MVAIPVYVLYLFECAGLSTLVHNGSEIKTISQTETLAYRKEREQTLLPGGTETHILFQIRICLSTVTIRVISWDTKFTCSFAADSLFYSVMEGSTRTGGTL